MAIDIQQPWKLNTREEEKKGVFSSVKDISSWITGRLSVLALGLTIGAGSTYYWIHGPQDSLPIKQGKLTGHPRQHKDVRNGESVLGETLLFVDKNGNAVYGGIHRGPEGIYVSLNEEKILMEKIIPERLVEYLEKIGCTEDPKTFILDIRKEENGFAFIPVQKLQKKLNMRDPNAKPSLWVDCCIMHEIMEKRKSSISTQTFIAHAKFEMRDMWIFGAELLESGTQPISFRIMESPLQQNK
jgi:hypothetical protein